jgi:Transcriptional regulator
MDISSPDISSPKVLSILDQVKTVFAAKGFEGASMQDLAEAAQMSVGNFYRYFPSKNAIVTAMIRRDLLDIEADFEAVRASENPSQTFLNLLASRIENLSMAEAALWTEMQAASFRVPEIAELKLKLEMTIRGGLINALAQLHKKNAPEDLERFGTFADLTIVMVHGYAQCLSCRRLSPDDAATRALGKMVFETLRSALLSAGEPNS